LRVGIGVVGFLFAESDAIGYRSSMKTLSVTEVARNFSAVLDGVEREQEEVVLVRNRRQIARLTRADRSPAGGAQVSEITHSR